MAPLDLHTDSQLTEKTGAWPHRMQEALRQRQLEANTPRHVVAALKGYGEAVDEVLWAALFAASMITRPDSLFFDQVCRIQPWQVALAG